MNLICSGLKMAPLSAFARHRLVTAAAGIDRCQSPKPDNRIPIGAMGKILATLRRTTLVVLLGPLTAFAFPATQVVSQGDHVNGLNAEGHVVWQYHAKGPVQVEPRVDGLYEINGSDLINRDGRLLTRISRNAKAQLPPPTNPILDATATQTWGTVATLVPTSSFFSGPVFDDLGNAYVVVEDDVNGTSDVMKSDGSSGTWHQLLALPGVQYASDGSIAIASDGDITIAKVDADEAGENLIMVAVRYQPGTGWSAPVTLLTVPSGTENPPINNVYVAADAQGDAIVVGDAIDYGAAYSVYSQKKQQWLPARQMPVPYQPDPTTPTVNQPALSVSNNRQFIQYSYASGPILSVSRGLFTNAFDSKSLMFRAPNFVKGTNRNVGYYDNHGDKTIASVDNDGNIEILWVCVNRSPYCPVESGLYGSRFEGGRWSDPVQVSSTYYELDSFAGQSTDEQGDFIVSTPYGNAETDIGQLVVLKYMVGSGWSEQTAATWQGGMQDSATSISWMGTNGGIIGVFMIADDSNAGYNALSFSTWNGTTWSATAPAPYPIPNHCYFHRLAEGPNGQISLIFNPMTANQSWYFTNTYASFLSLP